MTFQRTRPLRKSPWIRNLLQEHHLHPSDFIYPIFVRDDDMPRDIPGFGDVKRHSLKELPFLAEKIAKHTIPAVALFPCVQDKTKDGRVCLQEDALMVKAIQALKGYGFGIISDIALDPYTTHGHDGVLTKDECDVDNDKTIEILSKMALLYAQAGVDVVAPSAMMDGCVQSIKNVFDKNEHRTVLIFSYSAKFASSLYKPFRSAISMSALKGARDKKTYQLPISNRFDALKCIERDIIEGADAIIIKPACLYLDIVFEASKKFNIPIFVYQVSGEYMLIKDNKDFLQESFLSFKRAGARGIISYAALE